MATTGSRRKIDPGWEGFFEGTFNDLLVDARAAKVEGDPNGIGIRLQIVVIGATDEFLTTPAERRAWLVRVAEFANAHRDQVMFVEVANESTGIGLGVAELAELVTLWREVSSIPVAASAIYQTDDDLVGYNGRIDPNEEGIGMEKFYQSPFGAGVVVDLLTPHFDRDTASEGYRPSRQAWEAQWYDYVPTSRFTNNEPIGCGSSVDQTCEPRFVVQDFLTTFASHGAGYVWHTSAGVRGDIAYWDLPNAEAQMTAFRAMLALLPPNTVNGVNANHHWPGHPYGNLPDQIWADLAAGAPGVVRVFAIEVGGRFYVFPMGLRNTYEIEAKWDMTIEVFSAVDGTLLETVTLDQGQRHTFREVNGLRDFVHRVSRR